ncbi:MAG TPA: GNAT family N-acetyltransferase [Cellulomonas sp.]
MAAEQRRMAPPPDVVIPLAKQHVPAAARVVATALANDPGYRLLLPDDARRVAELTALYRMTLADTVAHGRGLVTMLGPVVTGALATYPPGAYPMTPARWARSGARLAGIAGLVRAQSVALIRFGRLVASAVPRDSWYFQALGIRPDLQGTGRGTTLLRSALALVDAAGASSYLETNAPENVAYYERFGYASLREPVALAPDGPWIHAMLRPARRS